MSFISWQYLIFLPIVFLLYWRLSGKKRLLLLLAASYLFYAGWDVRFLALVMATTVIDFLCALSIDGERTPSRWVLLLALAPAAWTAGVSSVAAGQPHLPPGHGPGRGPGAPLVCGPRAAVGLGRERGAAAIFSSSASACVSPSSDFSNISASSSNRPGRSFKPRV